MRNPDQHAAAVAEPPSPEPTRPRRSRRREARAETQAPKPAEGIELIGEYEGSGFKEAPYLARRADGQVLQLTALLYAVAVAADGRRDARAMAAVVSEELGRNVSADNVSFLVEKKLRPLGVLAAADGSSPKLERPDPLLALKFRTAVVPDWITRSLTTVFRPLFLPPVVVALVAAFLVLDVWLFLDHGIADGLRRAIYQPVLLLGMFAGVVLATAFHEIGHATACRYGGGKPGVMGVGIYIVWPAFYTDVTDAYRLGRTGRLRTDLGGIYFNAIFALIVAGAYALTRFEPLLLLIVVQNFAMLQQLLPFLRLDGYYIISDLTGVPDMFSRIRPVLRSLRPGKKSDPRVQELKPWVRVVVSSYVFTVVPVLGLVLLVCIVHAPRMFATAWDSLAVQADKVSAAFADGFSAALVAGVLQLLALGLPSVGMALTFARVGSRAGRGAWSWSSGHPGRRAGLVTAAGTGLALAAFTWWPNGEYRPIQPGEKGTLSGALNAVADVPTGRPSLTPEREAALGGAPTVRELDGEFRFSSRARERDAARQDGSSRTGLGDRARRRLGGAGSRRGGGAPNGPVGRSDPDTDRDADACCGRSRRPDRHPGAACDRDADADADTHRHPDPAAHRDPDAHAHAHADPHAHPDTDSMTDTEVHPTMPRRSRHLLGALLAAVLLVAGPVAPADASSGDNRASAINRTDDTRVSDFAFSLDRQRGGVVDNANVAEAYASCVRCSAVAIAFQIVLVSGSPTEVRPVNVGAAVNENCDTCDSYAGAKQFVRVTRNRVELTESGREQLARIRHTLKQLSRSKLTALELAPKVDEQAARVRHVLDTELVPVEDDDD